MTMIVWKGFPGENSNSMNKKTYNNLNHFQNYMEDPKPIGMNKQSLSELEVRVVVFTLCENRLQVLLQPIQNETVWVLPGAKIRLDSSLEDAASGCVEFVTGIKEIFLEQLYTYGEPSRHEEHRVVTVVYFALLPSNLLLPKHTEQAGAVWHSIDQLPVIGWDHQEILTYALRRVRYKLEYTAIGFELLPNAFTLTELQHTYEIILGEILDKRNFRRRILDAGIIEPTADRRGGDGRPAQLYRYRPDAVAEVKARRLFP